MVKRSASVASLSDVESSIVQRRTDSPVKDNAESKSVPSPSPLPVPDAASACELAATEVADRTSRPLPSPASGAGSGSTPPPGIDSVGGTVVSPQADPTIPDTEIDSLGVSKPVVGTDDNVKSSENIDSHSPGPVQGVPQNPSDGADSTSSTSQPCPPTPPLQKVPLQELLTRLMSREQDIENFRQPVLVSTGRSNAEVYVMGAPLSFLELRLPPRVDGSAPSMDAMPEQAAQGIWGQSEQMRGAPSNERATESKPELESKAELESKSKSEPESESDL